MSAILSRREIAHREMTRVFNDAASHVSNNFPPFIFIDM